MHQNHEFHDSYYHHTCVVAPEKDVLETDIVGSGCGARIIRWWHDLFLLSYTSGRSRGFYNSSHSMKIERFRQFRKYRHRIHPMSKFRNFWDCLILHVFIVNKIIFMFTSSFMVDELPLILYHIGAFLEIIIILDLYVNLKTGYIRSDAKRVILGTEKSLINYCSKKLFIHWLSAMPLHWLMFLKYGRNITCSLCKANTFVCILKIISVFSIYRVVETSSYWTQKRHSSKRTYFYKCLKIGAIAIVSMCQFYDVSDALVLLVFMSKGAVHPKSMLAVRLGIRYGVLGRHKPSHFYISLDMNRLLKSFQLHSFGVAERIYYLDKLTSLIGFLLCKLFFIWIVMECYSFVSPLVYPQEQFIHLRMKVSNLLVSRQLSDELNLKVQQYFDFRPTRYKSLERNNELCRMLPEVLRKEAKLCRYLKLVMRIPYFADLPLPLLVDIVLLLREEIFLKNAILAEAYEQAEGLIIVDNGVLAVYSKNHKEQGHLIDGDFFGGLSLVTDQELCMSYVVAVTSCTILLLDKLRFRNLMRNHAQLFLDMKAQMKDRYRVRDSREVEATRRSSQLSQPSVKYWVN